MLPQSGKRVCTSQFGISGKGRENPQWSSRTHPGWRALCSLSLVRNCHLLLLPDTGHAHPNWKIQLCIGYQVLFFPFRDTPSSTFAPLLLKAFKPWGWTPPLQEQISDFRSMPFSLHKYFHLLHGFKTPLTAFNLAEDEYLCEPLAEGSLMTEQFITIKPSLLKMYPPPSGNGVSLLIIFLKTESQNGTADI